MSDDLQAENNKLRNQLKVFLNQARENENKQQRFSEQELQLISAKSIHDLIRLVIYQYPATFRLDCIRLVLFDPEYELVRMMEAAGLNLKEMPELAIETDPAVLQAHFSSDLRPELGPFIPERHTKRFTRQPQPIRSCAFIPLIRHGELIGSFNMGSYDPGRFTAGSGTQFLERLAAIVAICLENCANHHRLKQLGLTDPLTRVNNRRYFDQRLSEEVQTGQRKQHPLSCMFLDVDHFKQINDEHGHQAGDRVLQEVAMLISSQLRHSDVISRYGGEEFVVLLPDTQAAECHAIAERIRSRIENHQFRISNSCILQLTISIGISCLDLSSSSSAMEELAGNLVASADEAVYQAKEKGRNCVVLHGNT